MQRAIDRWLEGDVHEAAENRVAVRAVIQQDSDRGAFTLDLELRSGSGQSRQVLHALSCRALVDLVALKAALLLQPLEVAEAVVPPAPGQVDPKPEVDPPSAPPALVAPEPGRALPLALGARLEADATLGLWPEPAWGGAVAGSLVVGAFRLEAGARHAFARALRYPDAPSTGADVSLTAGTLRGCAVPRLGRVELPLCLGVDAGGMRGRGVGVQDGRTSRQPWVGLSISPGISVPLGGPLWLTARIDGIAQLVRVRYRVQNLPRLYASDRTALRFVAGAEVRFDVTD